MPRLEADDYHARDGAIRELQDLGHDAAAVLVHMDRSRRQKRKLAITAAVTAKVIRQGWNLKDYFVNASSLVLLSGILVGSPIFSTQTINCRP